MWSSRCFLFMCIVSVNCSKGLDARQVIQQLAPATAFCISLFRVAALQPPSKFWLLPDFSSSVYGLCSITSTNTNTAALINPFTADPIKVFTAQAYARAVLGVVILSVCPSVHLSVTRVDCDKTKWRTADIFIPHERAITLLLCYQEWFVGDALSLIHISEPTRPY